jgi:transposase InsO family protein
VSERRACSAFPINRSTQRYQSRRFDQAGLKMKIRELAATRVRYGYRRIHVLLRREGWEINHKRTHRLYREMGLQLRNKTPKRKVKAKLRDDRAPAWAPNECWSMDFLSDQLFDGRKIRVLSIIDNFSRVSPALDVRMSYPGSDVVQTLERVAATHGDRSVFVWQWAGIYLEGFGSLGLDARCRPRLQSPRKTDGQRVRRVLQRPRPGRMPQCLLVLEPGRCSGKM